MTKQNRIEQLKHLFPEAVINGQVDCLKLQQILGDNSIEKDANFGLHWLGKSEVFKDIEQPPTTQLVFDKDKSISPQITENQFIEGENLEVLRHLQQTHKETIKLIYIDPPYNTGNDHFVYSDNFVKSKADWHENDRENERFHWLNDIRLKVVFNGICNGSHGNDVNQSNAMFSPNFSWERTKKIEFSKTRNLF